MTTTKRVTKEIVDLHDFFTAWFNGTAEPDELEPKFLSRLHEKLVFIPPEGHLISGPMLREGFNNGYGTNPNFKIQIRDVSIKHEVGKTVLATYTEWQTGSTLAEHANNARVTSVLMDLGVHVTWRHIHETWLPESERLAGSFNY